MNRLRGLVGVAAMWAVDSASAQGVPATVQTAEQALAVDAATWGLVAGIPPGEALARLRAQAATVPVTDALAREFGDRLAGLWIDQHAGYRIEVLLTGDTPVTARAVAAGGLTVPVTFRTGAAVTRETLLVALADRQAALRDALVRPPGIGIDPRSGSLVVLATAADVDAEGRAPLAARLSAIAGVPVSVRAMGREDDMGVEGGARVVGRSAVDGRRYACTTGFTVTDGARTGVVTAAHCPDDLTYVDPEGGGDVALDFVGQWGWGYQDVQVHASTRAIEPRFFADTAKTRARVVEGARPRDATRVGDVVCHRGERTGYSCAEVEYADFAPAGDLCGGACLPTWVAVRGPTCKGGDSGGPVFLGAVAYGIVKGGSYAADGRCGFYYYMSTDYLPAGWSLLGPASPPGGNAAPPRALVASRGETR